MAGRLFPDNKLFLPRQHIARCSVPNTIGVYQQHHWCLLTTPLVLTNNTIGAYQQHSGRKWEERVIMVITIVYSKPLMADLYEKRLSDTNNIIPSDKQLETYLPSLGNIITEAW